MVKGNNLNEIFSQKRIYQYNYNDYTDEMIYYQIEEIKYNSKKDKIKEITKSMGEINLDIVYESIYDEKFNLMEERLNRYFTDMDDVIVYYYENTYDEDNRLIKVVKKDNDGKIFGTTDYIYNNFNQLIRKEIKYNGGFYETINYLYNDGKLYEESIFKNGKLSHYKSCCILEDGRIKKTLINPARGKYKWELSYDGEDSKSCQVYMHKPILTVDMIKEIMDYIITNYKGIINCVIIDIYNVNLNYKYDDPDIYKYYYDNYGITILENF